MHHGNRITVSTAVDRKSEVIDCDHLRPPKFLMASGICRGTLWFGGCADGLLSGRKPVTTRTSDGIGFRSALVGTVCDP